MSCLICLYCNDINFQFTIVITEPRVNCLASVDVIAYVISAKVYHRAFCVAKLLELLF